MKILNKLTIKHLTMNKKRTIVTIVGVLLSTALMVGIGLLFATLRDNTIKSTISSKGAQHVRIKDLSASKRSILENNVEIKDVYYRKDIGFAELKGSENDAKPYVLVSSASQQLLDQFELIKGRLPQNDSEIVISSHIRSNGGVSYQVGDTVTYDIGPRYIGGNETLSMDEYIDEETLAIKEQKTYKIVGIVGRTFVENYSSPGFMVFTKLNDLSENEELDAYIVYKQVKNIYKKTESLSKNLGLSSSELMEKLDYNDSLLSAYGVSRYSNIMDAMTGVIIIVLTLISAGCIVVIYNSFAISVMERKKQFGLFSSIGSTRKQLRHTVFFEALVVGAIGIPLGIISAIVGIGVVIMIINQLLPDIFRFALVLTIYPVFMIVPICFMIVVIILSAFLPAFRASKITPIEAIRQNDDIKIKGKKVKTSKLIRKLFGMEGELALKNIKRNKKKYRITVISLFISIVLFISFSSLMHFALNTTDDIVANPRYDLTVQGADKDPSKMDNLFKTLKNHEETEDITYIKTLPLYSKDLKKHFTKKALKASEVHKDQYVFPLQNNPEMSGVVLVSLDSSSYKKYLEQLKVKKGTIVVLNHTSTTTYGNGKRKTDTFNILNDKIKELKIYGAHVEASSEKQTEENVSFEEIGTLNNLYYTDKEPLGTEYMTSVDSLVVIVPESVLKEFKAKTVKNAAESSENVEALDSSIYIKASTYKNLDKYLTDLEKNHDFQYLYYQNVIENMQFQKNFIFVIYLLLYGFIALVTLIGVTSVFNTIGTSISLRRKEFAMLRSMGLTPKGFNKILFFESLFFGLKSLFYGIPVSLLVIYFIGKQISGVVTINGLMIPWDSILIAVIGVFIIIFISMMYATSKIKKENILDAIREENI